MTKKIFAVTAVCTLFFLSSAFVFAEQTVNYNASDLLVHSEVMITPQSGTFTEGSTFDVPIYVNTKGYSINAIELNIKFDPAILSIVHPSGDKSITGLWVEPPTYDNTKGTAHFAAAIPGGITTDSGLFITITFQAKASGQASVSIDDASRILLNDGQGSQTVLDANRGTYTIVPKPPAGVQVFSDTHPFQDQWYNNNNPVLTWNKDPGVMGFSYVLDDKPNTVPDNTITATGTLKAYQDLGDGVWYFHIKALKQNVWGASTDYVVHVDTEPPAEFNPTVDYLSATAINRFLISYVTTDSLSGIDHYEIGVIDKSKPLTESPIFVQADSPYQLPFNVVQNARVIVRAIDKAGNVRDESIDITVPFIPWKFITDHATILLISLLSIILLFFILNYLIGHHLIRRLKKMREVMHEEDKLEQREMLEKESLPPQTPPQK